MKRSLLRVIPFFLYGMTGVFFGCDTPNEESTPGVPTFDQSREVQDDLSAQAQQALDTMNKQQQEEQTVEVLDSHQRKQEFPSLEPSGDK